jgi:hypothetical protein
MKSLSKLDESKKKELFSDAYIFEMPPGLETYVDVGVKIAGIDFVKFGFIDEKTDNREFDEWFWKNYQKIIKLQGYLYLGIFIPESGSEKVKGNFFLVDGYDCDRKKYIDYEEIMGHVVREEVDMKALPQICKGKISDEAITKAFEEQSLFHEGHVRRIAIKNYEKQIFAYADRVY